MPTCVPFLRVIDIAKTASWYESIGFECTGINKEPGCEIDWARLEFRNAAFMLYPLGEISSFKDAGLYFELENIDGLIETLSGKAEVIEVTDRTFYGMKEIVFKDVNGFQVTFGCPATV